MENIIEKCKSMNGTINPRYDASIGDARQIFNSCRDTLELFSYSFRFGYMQGMKAARAEMNTQTAVQQ